MLLSFSLQMSGQDAATREGHRFEQSFAQVYGNLIHKPFPEMSFPDIHGRKWNSKDLAGRPSFIRISMRDCLPCKIELSYFIELADSMKDYHFVYLTPDDLPAIDASLKKAANITIIPNCKPELLLPYGITSGYPASFFTDSKGIIQKGRIGGRKQYAYYSKREWRDLLVALDQQH